MAAAGLLLSSEELERLGTEIYERSVNSHLRPEDHGKFVAIDARSGKFELDEDDYTAVTRLRDQLPDAQIWLTRAGFKSAYAMRTPRLCRDE